MKAFYRQRIPEPSYAKKETVDIDNLVTSKSGDRKIMHYIRMSRPSLRKPCPRHWNTGLMSSGVILNSWGEAALLALVGHPSSDGIVIKMRYGVCRCFITSTSFAPHLFLLGLLKLNLILTLDKLRPAQGNERWC